MDIALIGYGKMGKAIERIAIERGHDIVCRINSANRNEFESEAFRKADRFFLFVQFQHRCKYLFRP